MLPTFLSQLFNSYVISCALLAALIAILAYSSFLKRRHMKLKNTTQTLHENLKEANHIIENRGTTALEEELSLVRATLESRKDGIIVLNQQNQIIDYNQAVLGLLQIDEGLLNAGKIDAVINTILANSTNPLALKNTYDESVNDRDEEHHTEIHFKNNTIIDFYAYPQRMKNRYIGKILQFRDLTHIKKNESALLKQVNLDHLTQLPNRSLLVELINQSIRNARRNRLFLAVLVLDIDKFKKINEHVGYVTADKLLQSIAEKLQINITSNDSLARISADKFAIIYAAGSHANDVADFAKTCLEKTNTAHYIEGQTINAPMSIGIAIYPKDGDEPEELLKNADIAMRRAKTQGGNISQFFTDTLNKKYKERLMIENHLRNALKLNEFSLLYHPILDITDKKMVGVEVLLRWYHPILGDMSPAVFVPIAEQNGMILPIGYWILKTGCEQIKKWQTLGMDCYISFNISAKQFSDPNFIDHLKTILEETQLSPDHIALEVTEQLIMANVNESIYLLKALKRLGVKIIVDDFGTGNSCLNILDSLPIDKIKIDNNFTAGISTKTECEKKIACICAIANQFQFDLIAEGITSSKQEKFLSELNCHEMQGFLYYKPLTVEALTREIIAMLALQGKSPKSTKDLEGAV